MPNWADKVQLVLVCLFFLHRPLYRYTPGRLFGVCVVSQTEQAFITGLKKTYWWAFPYKN